MSLVLAGNLDVVDPAHALPISITWSEATVRGEVLSSALFAVTRVSVEHYNDADGAQPPKTVTWALEQVTDFAPGETAPVRQMSGVTPPAEGTCSVSAAFSSSVADATVTFTDASTGDLLMRWRWDFGDGTYSNLRNPVHVYGATGTYSVTLTVISACGASDTATDDVVITSSVGLWAGGIAVTRNVSVIGRAYAVAFDGDWGTELSQGTEILSIYLQDGTSDPVTPHTKYMVGDNGVYKADPYAHTSTYLKPFHDIFSRYIHYDFVAGDPTGTDYWIERLRIYVSPDDNTFLVFAAGYSQFSVSFDSGATWLTREIYDAGGNFDATAHIAFSHHNTLGSERVYAFYHGYATLFRTDDRFATWSLVFNGHPLVDETVYVIKKPDSLCVPFSRDGGADNIPDSSQVVYILLWEELADHLPHLLRSDDAGATFADLGTVPRPPVSELIAHPSTSLLLYYIDIDNRVQWTDDGGSVWHASSIIPDLCNKIAVNASDADYLIAYHTHERTTHKVFGGLFYSPDRGISWIQTTPDSGDIYPVFGIEG